MDKSRIPLPPEGTRWHRTAIQMRFNDIDMFGHLNNGAYFQYADLGKLRFFTDLMDEPFNPAATGLVIASIHCDFYVQTYMAQDIAVLTAVEALGTKSVTIEQRIVSGADDEVHAIVRSVLVQFNPSTGATAPIPDLWRERLGHWLQPR